jgi:hypothetical protein
MSGFWILMLFSAGGCVGFLGFAMMNIAADGDRHQGDPERASFVGNDSGS